MIDAQVISDLVTTSGKAANGATYTGIVRTNVNLDLGQLTGWGGATLHAQGIVSLGKRPNDRAGTIQGINNIEVPENRAKIFEFYLEQKLGGDRTSLRLGFSDLNSEFYATDSSALLIAPAFGIGSELSATGPNGPSLFPSTALGARINVGGDQGTYARAAVINAAAGVLGDRGGIRPMFDAGALAIVEGGCGGSRKLAIGGWTYTARQNDLRDVDSAGLPMQRTAFGGYVLADVPVTAKVSAFVRVGISDARTTPFKGGWQAGVMVADPLASRPHGQLSFGLNQAWLSHRYRANVSDGGGDFGPSETGAELTYADQIGPRLTVQPDLQLIWKADRQGPQSPLAVATLRVIIDF